MPRRTNLQQAIETMHAVSWALLKERRFGARAGDVLILMGVMIGDAERKPLSAYKLAGFVGVPHPSVIRKLRGLERAGLIVRDGKKRYWLSDEARRRASRMP